MSFLDFLSPALTVGTQAAGTYQGAKHAADEEQKNDLLKLVGLLRQKQLDESEMAYRQAEGDQARAHANWFNETPLKPMIDANGNVQGVPTRTGPGGPSRAQSSTASAPPTPPLSMAGVSDSQDMAGGDALPPPAPQGVAAAPGVKFNPPNQQRPIPGLVGGKPTMVVPGMGGTGTPLTVNGQTVAPIPRPPRASGGSSGDMGLVHTITAVRAQIDETRRAIAAAQSQSKGLATQTDSALMTPGGLQGAQSARSGIPALQQRLDSLTKVHDALVARQQAAQGASPPAATSQAPAQAKPPAQAPAPVRPRANPAEVQRANRQLQTVLSAPDATPADKAAAQKAYDARMRILNTGAATPEGEQEDRGDRY